MAFDVSEQETAREELNRHVKAHDETLNHVADGVAIFGSTLLTSAVRPSFIWDLEEGYPSIADTW